MSGSVKVQQGCSNPSKNQTKTAAVPVMVRVARGLSFGAGQVDNKLRTRMRFKGHCRAWTYIYLWPGILLLGISWPVARQQDSDGLLGETKTEKENGPSGVTTACATYCRS